MQGVSKDAKETVSCSPQRACGFAGSRPKSTNLRTVCVPGGKPKWANRSLLTGSRAGRCLFVSSAPGFFAGVSSGAAGGRCRGWVPPLRPPAMQLMWLKILFQPLASNALPWFLSALTLRLDEVSALPGSSSAYPTYIP